MRLAGRLSSAGLDVKRGAPAPDGQRFVRRAEPAHEFGELPVGALGCAVLIPANVSRPHMRQASCGATQPRENAGDDRRRTLVHATASAIPVSHPNGRKRAAGDAAKPGGDQARSMRRQ